MTDKTLSNQLFGEKGGGGGGGGGGQTVVKQTVIYQAPPPRTPVEAPNSLQSRSVARIIDLLCEGEIEGPGNDTWSKSIYFDEVPYQSSTGTTNFQGVTHTTRLGSSDQSFINGFDKVETGHSVNTHLTKAGGGVSRQVSNSDIDDVLVTILVPALMSQNAENGDVSGTSVSITIKVTPNGGSPVTVKTETISGKCISAYERQVRISDISQYGNAPWIITLERSTADSGTSRIQNDTYWKTYTEVVNSKFSYPDSALMATELDSKQFGSQIPSRQYYIKGLKINVPDNRYYDSDTDTVTYSGAWNGTFKVEWCDNPAWVLYDLSTNSRYGLGLDVDYVDKWELYTCGVYNDAQVPWEQRSIQSDGTYATASGTERRFTFNHLFSSSTEAIYAITHVCSAMRAFPIYINGKLSVVQDRPADVTHIFNNTNVINGFFNYEGTGKNKRTNTVYVSWTDPDDFCKRTIEVVESKTGVARYGIQKMEISTIGCTSQSRAHRIGKWALDTDLNATETVTFRSGMDAADLFPGDVFSVADGFYAAEKRGGRIQDYTSTSITIEDDRPVDIDFGETYTLFIQTSESGVLTRTLTNTEGDDQTVLTFDEALDPPTTSGLVWVLTSTDLSHRTFRCISNREVEKVGYEITGILYDSTKYERVENNISVVLPITTRIGEGALTPPTSLNVYEYPYIVGDPPTYKFGCMFSWIHSTDPRTQYYETRIYDQDTISGSWEAAGSTTTSEIDIKPIASGTYTFQVRGHGIGGTSEWVSLPDQVMYNRFYPYPPTNLDTYEGDGEFTTYDCELVWDASIGAYTTSISGTTISGVESYGTIDVTDSIKDYKVEIRRYDDDFLLRSYYTTDTNYIYHYDANEVDHDGVSATFKANVYSRDKLNRLSTTAASLEVSAKTPPIISGIETIEGGTTYSGADCVIDWTDITEGKHKDYRVSVYKTDGTLLRTVHVSDNQYNYTYDANSNDNQGDPQYQIKFRVWDHDYYGQYSSTADAVTMEAATVPDVTGLQVIDGSTTIFNGPDIHITWNNMSTYTSLKDYRVRVYDVDDDFLREEFINSNKYVYTFSKNEVDHTVSSGVYDPQRQIKFVLRARNVYGRVSENDTVMLVINPAPDMAGTSPDVTAMFKGLKIDWSNIRPTDDDGKKYKIYCNTVNPPTTEITELPWDNTVWYANNLSTEDLYYVQIEPFDYFGAGTKSSVPAGVQPIKVTEVDIDAELTSSIAITLSGSTSGSTADLYDRIKNFGGVTFSGTGHIEYAFHREDFIDRVQLWSSTATNVYVSYKRTDGNWNYLKAQADHTLVSGTQTLLEATDEVDAQTNYWTTNGAGVISDGIFPQGIIADTCRLHIYSAPTTIYELYFNREVIAEQVTADNLSSISADVGVIVAGIIQSADGKLIIDLNNNLLLVKDENDAVRVKMGKIS